jgi:hypothetical protein
MATWTNSGHGVDERRPRRGRTTGSLLRDGGHKLPSWTAGSLLCGQARRARRRGAARARGPCAAARAVGRVPWGGAWRAGGWAGANGGAAMEGGRAAARRVESGRARAAREGGRAGADGCAAMNGGRAAAGGGGAVGGGGGGGGAAAPAAPPRGRLRGDEWRAGGGARSSERVTSEREGALRPRRTKIVVS